MKQIRTVLNSGPINGREKQMTTINRAANRFVLLQSMLLLMLIVPLQVQSQPSLQFDNSPLKDVLITIQQETGYFFLYRESQVAGIILSFASNRDSIIDDLQKVLQAEEIELIVDEDRKQVLLVKRNSAASPPRSISVQGRIVDASSGERLPYATVSWKDQNTLHGVTASASGSFSINRTIPESQVDLTFSYLGFEKKSLSFSVDENSRIEDLTVRLNPEPITGNEVIISGFSGYNPSDTLLTGLMNAARFSPLGESNSIRALQNHPSVAKTAAINNGLNVRGSTPDGFRVLLDGMSIFNQSHLFGLLDSFNADAIQSSGFYYGVAPAHIDTPTGGTLNLITRTGSLNRFNVSAGLSNTSVNGTFDGPIGKRGSWLVSARSSYIDRISWFNNRELIRWGLDINRPRIVASDAPDFTDSVLRPGDQSAAFYDIHGKFYLEGKNADRLIFSAYAGGNDISQNAQRRSRTIASEGQFTFEDVQTLNEWVNVLASVRYERQLSLPVYSSTLAGLSTYRTDFRKDDFVYSRVTDTGSSESILVFAYPFMNQSSMNEFRLHQDFELRLNRFTTNTGVNWSYYYAEYSEESFDRPSYFSETGAHLADAYVQTRWEPVDQIELQAGIRGHYYSLDNHFYYAPRVMLSLFPTRKIRVYGGYAKNYQFLHKVTLENNTTADVWTLSTSNQPPAFSDQILAGISIAPVSEFYFRAEAYLKSYENLRSHELNTQSLANTFSETPWFFQNNGEAKGIEFLLRNKVGNLNLSQSYTLSRMTFTNPFLLDEMEFPADWDRTHTYNATLEMTLFDGLDLFISWLMMSGAPNKLFTFGNDDATERLDSYRRLDTTLSYSGSMAGTSFEISATVYNVLNRDNVWYRDYAFNFNESQSIPRLTPVPVDILDLGFQPSFKLTVSF